MKELLLLQIRNLIADKEMCIANANRETAMGGWIADWSGEVLSINVEIERLFTQFKEVK